MADAETGPSGRSRLRQRSRLILEGDATITGSILIANRTSGNLGRAGIVIKDRAQLHFSQEALRKAGRLLSARLRTWQELPATQ